MPDDHRSTEMLTAGGAMFGKLKALGVDYVFANSGTDFPPIIEGLIEARQRNIDLTDARDRKGPIRRPNCSHRLGLGDVRPDRTGP